MELFVCAFGYSEPHHPQTDVSLEMGKQHFDLSSLDERGQHNQLIIGHDGSAYPKRTLSNTLYAWQSGDAGRLRKTEE